MCIRDILCETLPEDVDTGTVHDGVMHIGTQDKATRDEVGLNAHYRRLLSVAEIHDTFAVRWDSRVIRKVVWPESTSRESIRRHAGCPQIVISAERLVDLAGKDA